jgi:hypothetical protein
MEEFMREINRLLIIILFSLFIFYQGCKSKDENTEQLPAHGNSGVMGELSYTVPNSWKEEIPSGSMRKAQFRLPGVEGAADAEMAIFVFPGSGGGVQANINRWIGQFKQPDGSNSMDKAEIKKIESNGLPVTLVYVAGTYLKGTMGGTKSELADYAMIAAIVETSTDPWFFKTVGPEKTINHWRPAFEKFAGTIK